MMFIRQGATHKVVVGPAVAVGDGFTPVTTLALSSADEAEAILHDNGTVVDISGYTWAAITTADGYYHLTLQSGISNTVGHMTIVVNDDSLCLPLRADFTVVEEAVYDMLYAASAVGYIANAPVNVAQVSGDSTAADTLELFAEALDQATGQIDSGSFAAGAIDAAAIANNAIDAATFAADVDAEILSYLVDDATRIDASALNTATGTTIPAILDDTDLIDDGTSGLAKIATDVAAILVDTGTTLQAELDGIQADTEDIQSRLPAALTADGNIKADALRISGSATAADNLEQVFDTDFADVYNATDNHWHVDVQQVKGSGTAAQNLTTVFATDFATNYDSTNDKWNTRADLQTIKGQTVTCAAGVTVGVYVGGAGAAATQANLDDLANQVGSAGDGLTNIQWNPAWDAEVQSEVADALTAFAWSGITVSAVSGAVGSVTGNVGGNVTGSVGSLATQAKADVNAEVLDVLATDTFAEPSAVVAATSSLKDKINWIFSLLRNKRTQTATTETLYRDDGSTTTATSAKSDDGTTLTRGEWT